MLNEKNFTYYQFFDKTNKVPFLITDYDYKLKMVDAEQNTSPFVVNLDGKKTVIDLHKLVDKFDIVHGNAISVSEFEKDLNLNKRYASEVDGKRKNRTLQLYIKELIDKGLISKDELVLDPVHESLLFSRKDFISLFM